MMSPVDAIYPDLVSKNFHTSIMTVTVDRRNFDMRTRLSIYPDHNRRQSSRIRRESAKTKQQAIAFLFTVATSPREKEPEIQNAQCARKGQFQNG